LRRAIGKEGVVARMFSSQSSPSIARRKVIDVFEERYVERILAAHDGNAVQAARASGLALRYFRLVKARHQPKP
jgi:hypothetical protein